MADAIPTWQIQKFSDNVEHLLQEQGGKLRSAVTYQGGYSGKSVSPVNYLGTTTAQRITDRKGPSPNMGMNHTRRWLNPIGYEWGDLVETNDALFTGITPTGQYTEAGVKAMRRAEDVEIIQAFWGTALTGESGASTEAWSDTGYVVAESVGGANTGLNKEKLLEVRRLLQKYYVDLDMEEIHMIITEQDEQDLLSIASLLSQDYIDGRPTQTGKLPQILGINFHMFSSTTLETISDTTAAASIRSLPVWVKSGMHLGSWKERNITIAPDPSYKFKPRIYMDSFFGATRLQLGKVLKVKTYHA